ncbi:hypothetical protein NE555_15770, partial [Alistipes onderdonkii]|uniref:hypothetical protein n=1 Tax=Alistipes onderdonkii TaxID=328813 RepID=UPI00210B9DAE
MSSVNRIDDLLLTPGNGGQAIEFGKEEETPLSTIAEVLAAPIDEVYKVEGQVIVPVASFTRKPFEWVPIT